MITWVLTAQHAKVVRRALERYFDLLDADLDRKQQHDPLGDFEREYSRLALVGTVLDEIEELIGE